MSAYESYLATAQDRHDAGFCDGCGEIPRCCTCTDDDTPTGEIPPGTAPRHPVTDTQAALSRITGLCTEHGMAWGVSEHWSVCLCRDGRHDGNPVLERIPADDEAMARRTAAGGYGRHVVRQWIGQYTTRAEGV